MDNNQIYFVNSQGKRAVIASAENRNFFEMKGRSGFSAPDVDVFTERMTSGAVKYFGKTLKPRTVSIKMLCRGDSQPERDAVFFEMLNTLLDANGKGEGRLYVRRSDGARFFLNCVYTGGMQIAEEYRRFKKFTLSFYAVDPTFYQDAAPVVISQKPQQIGIDNLSGTNMGFEMVIADFYEGYDPEGVWEIDGTVKNLTTDKQLKFRHWKDVGNIMRYIDIPNTYRMIVDLRDIQKNIYLETEKGERASANEVIVYDGTDLDFAIVPGLNNIEVNLSGFGRSRTDTKIYFRHVCYGV